MKYIYKINGTKAELIQRTEEYDSLIIEQGIHWESVPFTPIGLREKAYETEKCIEWEGTMMIVDEANATKLS